MRIIPNWRRKLLRAYSSHVQYLTVGLAVVQQIFPVIADYVPQGWQLSLLVLFVIATIVEQPELRK